MGAFTSHNTPGRAERLSIPPQAHALSGLPASLWDEMFPSLNGLIDAIKSETCGYWQAQTFFMLGDRAVYRNVILCQCGKVCVAYRHTRGGFALREFMKTGDPDHRSIGSHSPSCDCAARGVALFSRSVATSGVPLSLWGEEFGSLNSLLERMDEITDGTWEVRENYRSGTGTEVGTIWCAACHSCTVGYSQRGTFQLKGFMTNRYRRSNSGVCNRHFRHCPVMERKRQGTCADVYCHRLLLRGDDTTQRRKYELLTVLGPGTGLYRETKYRGDDSSVVVIVCMPSSGDREARSHPTRQMIPTPPGLVISSSRARTVPLATRVGVYTVEGERSPARPSVRLRRTLGC
ncbi:hypothetical protein KIPB_000376 [Kipferlia bialata]|uniref:Uncharacterized protein n=1 Tax=Kipferlia bialata TaxID=797122 RepID=A0A9K3CNB2_9EUKA|nr:hypothetical protein KIPB_000376 [Kipferlia bialata]|eukprot:g376.t1